MLKQGLQQKQQQKLSPLQIQTIKLLELPTLELEQKIRKEIEENPVLDEITESGDPDDDSPKNVSLSEYPADDPTPSALVPDTSVIIFSLTGLLFGAVLAILILLIQTKVRNILISSEDIKNKYKVDMREDRWYY